MQQSTVSHSSRKGPHTNIARSGMRPARTTILHLTADLEVGVGGREVVDLAIQSHRAGWRPIIASAGGPLVLEAERAAVRHTRMPINRQNLFARWRSRVQLEALVQRERPALIHAHGFESLAVALSVNKIHRQPLLVDLTEPAVVTRPLQKLLQALAMRGARFRVPSDYMVQHLQREFRLQSDFIYRIFPGIDLHWFDAARVTPERLQKLSHEWRLPEQATIIVMGTPLAPGYGHQQLLEALAKVQRPDTFAVMIGDDRTAPGTREEIEHLVTVHSLEGKVIMPENCADWPAACWLASVVVAANTAPRGQAMELLAAQAVGRPVIVTDCGANNELVQSGETAWVVPQDDKEALTQALAEALQMTEAQRIDLAMRTRDFIDAMFPQEIWRDSLFDVYSAMLEQPMTGQ
jgi:glycosyltransferase involved in cell wall biosynthesis